MEARGRAGGLHGANREGRARELSSSSEAGRSRGVDGASRKDAKKWDTKDIEQDQVMNVITLGLAEEMRVWGLSGKLLHLP